MSRQHRPFPAFLRLLLPALLAVVVLLAPQPLPAGVILIGPDSYRLDDGPPVAGAWEIAEKLAYAKDVAIVVMEPKAGGDQVQTMVQLLETLKVPTIMTKQADYKILLDRGVLRPTRTP